MANSTSTTAARSRVVTGLFKDNESAECAYSALSSRGYGKDDLNVVMSDETRDKYYPAGSEAAETEVGSKALEGAGAGSAIGGTVGAVLGAIAAIGTSIALPGLGLLIAGPIAGALVGAGAGGLTGGLIGALVGYGIPEEQAQAYEAGVKQGGIMLSVNPRTDEDAADIEEAWKTCRGEQIYSTAGQPRQTSAAKSGGGRPGAAPRKAGEGETAIPVLEEELQVGKREVQGGGVRVSSHVTERPVEETVTLRDETVHVDRRPVNRAAGEADMTAMRDGTIEMTETGEEAVVSKQARVVEEVVVSKDATERQETVRDTVRRTEVDVEQLDANTKAKGRGSDR